MKSKCAALLLGAMGLASSAAASENAAGVAEKRGLSPIITQDIKTITGCKDAQSLIPNSAPNDFSPIAKEIPSLLGLKGSHTIDEMRIYKSTLLELPKHGQVQLVNEPSQHWKYIPTKGYTGADRSTYLVEAQGKQFKVVINFWVVEVIDENRQSQVCDSVDFGATNGSTPTLTELNRNQ